MGKMDVKHVAKLANLPIATGQEEKLAKEFEQTIKFVDVVKSLDTEGIKPISQVSGLVNVARPDEVDESRIIKVGDYFKVPAIFGSD